MEPRESDVHQDLESSFLNSLAGVDSFGDAQESLIGHSHSGEYDTETGGYEYDTALPQMMVNDRPWTAQENQKLSYAIHQFGNDWNKIADFIGTRDPQSIAIYAQRYLSSAYSQVHPQQHMSPQHHKGGHGPQGAGNKPAPQDPYARKYRYSDDFALEGDFPPELDDPDLVDDGEQDADAPNDTEAQCMDLYYYQTGIMPEKASWLMCENCKSWRIVTPQEMDQFKDEGSQWYCALNMNKFQNRCGAAGGMVDPESQPDPATMQGRQIYMWHREMEQGTVIKLRQMEEQRRVREEEEAAAMAPKRRRKRSSVAEDGDYDTSETYGQSKSSASIRMPKKQKGGLMPGHHYAQAPIHGGGGGGGGPHPIPPVSVSGVRVGAVSNPQARSHQQQQQTGMPPKQQGPPMPQQMMPSNQYQSPSPFPQPPQQQSPAPPAPAPPQPFPPMGMGMGMPGMPQMAPPAPSASAPAPNRKGRGRPRKSNELPPPNPNLMMPGTNKPMTPQEAVMMQMMMMNSLSMMNPLMMSMMGINPLLLGGLPPGGLPPMPGAPGAGPMAGLPGLQPIAPQPPTDSMVMPPQQQEQPTEGVATTQGMPNMGGDQTNIGMPVAQPMGSTDPETARILDGLDTLDQVQSS